jgi:Protein of unknown function (DUF1488)
MAIHGRRHTIASRKPFPASPGRPRSRACDIDLSDEAQWRDDIASLAFPVGGHGAFCAVHRGAFRTLIGAEPSPQDCLGYFRRYETAFREAARAKIARKGISQGTSLHLTSRDVARKLIEDHQIAHGEQS